MTAHIKATDPVCGMQVDPASAPQSQHDGQTYFFCCDGCKRKFDQDPAGVLAARAEKDAAKLVQIGEPGSCCGHSAAASKSTSAPADESAIYTCPMHPEIEQVGPGDCPICGMDLEPKFIDWLTREMTRSTPT